VKEGIRYSFSVKQLRFALTHLFLLQIVALSLVTLVFRIGDEIYGVSPRSAGLIVFLPLIIGLGGGFVSLNILGRRSSRLKLILFGTIFAVIGFSCMSLSSIIGEWWYLDKIVGSLSLFIVGLAGPFLLIPAQTLIYENARNDFRGRVMGVWFALTSSLASLVALLVSYVTDRMGHVVAALVIIVVVASAYSFLLYRLLRKKYL
jgi:MFS family permease